MLNNQRPQINSSVNFKIEISKGLDKTQILVAAATAGFDQLYNFFFVFQTRAQKSGLFKVLFLLFRRSFVLFTDSELRKLTTYAVFSFKTL